MGMGYLYVRDGIKYRVEGNLEQAEVNFKRAIQNEEDNSDGYRELSCLYNEQGRYEEAIEVCNSYLEIRDNAPFALFNIATALHQLQNYKDEAHYINQLMLVNSSYPGLGYLNVCNLYELGETRAVKTAIEDAFHNDPKNQQLHLFSSKFYYEIGEKEKALTHLKFLMNTFYKESKYYVRFSRLAIELELFEEAESALRQALILKPTNAVADELYQKIPKELQKK
ncbi:MAG: tetratricopeptide repeat protein [Lachnospirales bacterium]